MTINEYDLIKEAENKIKGIAGVMTIIESSQIETIPSEVWSILSDEYSYAMKSLFREIGNQMSGTGNHHLLSASLLAHVFV